MIPLQYEGALTELINKHPAYVIITLGVLAIISLLIWKVSPFFFDKKNCEDRCKALEDKNKSLELRVDSLEEESKKHQRLIGSVSMFRDKLKELGYPDIPLD